MYLESKKETTALSRPLHHDNALTHRSAIFPRTIEEVDVKVMVHPSTPPALLHVTSICFLKSKKNCEVEDLTQI